MNKASLSRLFSSDRILFSFSKLKYLSIEFEKLAGELDAKTVMMNLKKGIQAKVKEDETGIESDVIVVSFSENSLFLRRTFR